MSLSDHTAQNRKANPPQRKPAPSQNEPRNAAHAEPMLTGQPLQGALENPQNLTPGALMALQRRVGNRAVQRLLAGSLVQTKPTVGAPGDAFEQEAEQTAAHVMREPSPAPGQRAESESGFDAGPDVERQLAAHRGGGQPLPSPVRSFMEPRFGADFSGVRIHAGQNAAQLNRQLSARAFTHGPDIYMGAGKYNPASNAGQRLLAHELTHVVQQGAAGQTGTGQARRQPASIRRQTAPHIQRAIMTADEFKTAAGTRRRGGYIKELLTALTQYHADKTPAKLNALRFAVEKYLATKGDKKEESDKSGAARTLLMQVKDEESQLRPEDQLRGLLPYKDDINAMVEKGKILGQLDKVLTGPDIYLREDLKRAILESPKPPNTIKQKVAALNLTGRPDEGQRQLIRKTIKDLSKGANPRKAAIYHSLYSRCIDMVSVIYSEHETTYDFSNDIQDKELTNLIGPIRNVTRIFAEALDINYSRKQAQERRTAQDELKKSGKEPLDVVVMGAGPVGMIAAIEAFLAGAKVHVYEMRRTGPARANVLKLTDPTFHKLRRLGVYGDLFGPDRPKGDPELSHGISVAFLEDVLRAKAAQLGIKISYGYQLDSITAPDQEGGKTKVKLKKYVPTRPGPEMDLYKKLEDQPDFIDATSDLVIGATGAGGSTRKALGLESERISGPGGEEYIDFTAVGIFTDDGKTNSIPGADADRDRAWVVGLRTPTVDYLLTQITREQFLLFKDDRAQRDQFVLDRGRKVAQYEGQLKASSVFDITLNQAKKFVSEESTGVLIGDEAATPHPLTGSGFNTGAATTDLVPNLVRGLATGKRSEAFKKYSEGTGKRTNKMVGMGTKFFEKNIAKLTEMNKLPEKKPTYKPYTLEDIGVNEQTQSKYDLAQQKVMDLYGLKSGQPEDESGYKPYTPEDIGVNEETQPQYDEAQQKVLELYGFGSRQKKGKTRYRPYSPRDIGVTEQNQSVYDEALRKIQALYNIPTITEED